MEYLLVESLKNFIIKSRLKEQDFKNLVLFFDSYYGGKANDRKIHEALNMSISNIINNPDEFTFNIIEGIKSYPGKKMYLAERLSLFLKFLKRSYDLTYNENMFDSFIISNTKERYLAILKYLHSGAKSRSEIAENFGISENTVSEDLSKLQDGFSFMGTDIKIFNLERRTNAYRSHVHPIFLALNSEEIYSLTIGLKLLSKGTVFEKSLSRISNLVYNQLSEDAKTLINNNPQKIERFSEEEPMIHMHSRFLFERNNKAFTYYLKEPIECNVTYKYNNEEVVYKGILKLAEPSHGNMYDRIIVESNKESIILDIDKIISIMSNKEYLYRQY